MNLQDSDSEQQLPVDDLESSTENDDPADPPRALIVHSLANSLLGFVGLGIHVWTTWLVYQAEGFWKSVLYFTLMIYAELHWAYVVFEHQGINVFSVVAGSWAVIYLVSIVTLGVQSKRHREATAGNPDAS